MTGVVGIGPVEVLILVLRVLFLVALYAVVVAVLLALRRQLIAPAPLGGHGGPSGRGGRVPASASPPVPALPWAQLTLVEAASVDGPPGRTVLLAGDTTIGRRPPADILLRDDAVSGRHARLAWRDGGWIVEDLGSTNGTYVNGRRLNRPAALHGGGVVVTGGATWRFEEGGDLSSQDGHNSQGSQGSQGSQRPRAEQR